MANVPVNIDVHILRTAMPFPNLLGPIMINDYIQGLKLGRKNNEAHLREFASDTSVLQLDRSNQQRILSTISAGKAYEDWCNKWFLSGTDIRDTLAQIFIQIDNLKLLAIANNVDITRVWQIGVERKILRDLIKVCCSTHDNNLEYEASVFYAKAAFPGSLTESFNEVIVPNMDYCQEENQFAEQHGNYLKSIFGEDSEAANAISACIAQTWRLIREKHEGQRFDLAQTLVPELEPVISWVTCMRPLFNLAETPLTHIPPTLDGFDGIAVLAPTEKISQLQSELWQERRPLLNNLRHDLYLVYVLSGAVVRGMPDFEVDYIHDDTEGLKNPFHPTLLLTAEFSQEPFWQNHQEGEEMVPPQFIEAVRALSDSTMRILETARRERSVSVRSEVSLGQTQRPSPRKEKKTPTGSPHPETGPEEGGAAPIAAPTIALDFPLEWALLIGVLGVAVVLSTY